MNRDPYTVPEGFFEESSKKTLAGVRRIRVRRRAACGAFACAVIALALGLSLNSGRPSTMDVAANDVATQYFYDEEIASIYDYDIFLNNFNL